MHNVSMNYDIAMCLYVLQTLYIGVLYLSFLGKVSYCDFNFLGPCAEYIDLTVYKWASSALRMEFSVESSR